MHKKSAFFIWLRIPFAMNEKAPALSEAFNDEGIQVIEQSPFSWWR